METLSRQPSGTAVNALPWQNSEYILWNTLREYEETANYSAATEVSEQEYWEQYYELSDIHLEWNNGILEEKSVSDHEGTLMFAWFFEVLGHFFKVFPIGTIMTLEMAFRMELTHKTVIRKPDMGVILNSNPVELTRRDNRYSGIADMCVEILSDSNRKNIERDTITKKQEYCRRGVQEYYILDGKNKRTVFYQLESGRYRKIKPVNGIISSGVLPGFQIRIENLSSRPSLEEMSEDDVYKHFMLPAYQAEKQKV